MTINTNPTELHLDSTLQQLGMTLQSLNNHLNNLKPAQKTMTTADRVIARQEYSAQNFDGIFGEMALSGLTSLAGLDVLDSLNDMAGGFGEALMEAAQDLHELDGKRSMSDLEKALLLRRRRAYEEELRQERRHEKESQKIKTMMTLMAMAVSTLEERVKRREKREEKRSKMSAFAQNNKAIALKKQKAAEKKANIITMNAHDIVMEAA